MCVCVIDLYDFIYVYMGMSECVCVCESTEGSARQRKCSVCMTELEERHRENIIFFCSSEARAWSSCLAASQSVPEGHMLPR